MTIMNVSVVKGKATVAINTDELPEAVYAEALLLGLKDLVNRKMSKITVAKLEGEDLSKAQAAAMEVAQKNVSDILSGNIRFSGQKAATKAAGGSRVVNTEAMRIARNIVKDTLKANNLKLSLYSAAEITAAAKEVLARDDGSIIKQAEVNIAARTASPQAIDLGALVANMKVDPKRAEKAAKEKAEKATQLSAKQAGMVAKKAKPTQAAMH